VALHIIKGGVTLSTLKLDGGAKYYMFGRAPKTCKDGHGFVINHPSLSRQHAVIIHAENDALYVIDLDSAHGTWVNNSRIVPYTPQLLENANILTFGQSTRRYVVRVFPKEDQIGADNSLSLSYKRLAGLRVSADASDEEEEEEEEEVSGDKESSKEERERQKLSFKQAQLYTGLNARVCYPSPKTMLSRKSYSTPPELAASGSVTDVAAAMAASASPTPSPLFKSLYTGKLTAEDLAAAMAATESPMLKPTQKAQLGVDDEFLGKAEEKMRGRISDGGRDSPYGILPPPCDSFPKPRARSLSTSYPSPSVVGNGHISAGSIDENVDAEEDPPQPGGSPKRIRSNSTSAAMKRPAPYQMYSKCIIRRRSQMGERRVSFSASGPELIGPSRLFDDGTQQGLASGTAKAVTSENKGSPKPSVNKQLRAVPPSPRAVSDAKESFLIARTSSTKSNSSEEEDEEDDSKQNKGNGRPPIKPLFQSIALFPPSRVPTQKSKLLRPYGSCGSNVGTHTGGMTPRNTVDPDFQTRAAFLGSHGHTSNMENQTSSPVTEGVSPLSKKKKRT